jgi:hypothetical protein
MLTAIIALLLCYHAADADSYAARTLNLPEATAVECSVFVERAFDMIQLRTTGASNIEAGLVGIAQKYIEGGQSFCATSSEGPHHSFPIPSGPVSGPSGPCLGHVWAVCAMSGPCLGVVCAWAWATVWGVWAMPGPCLGRLGHVWAMSGLVWVMSGPVWGDKTCICACTRRTHRR